MQVLDRESAPGVFVAGADNAKLAVEAGKDHLPEVGARAPQGAFAQRRGQVLPHALHDREDAFGGVAGMRHLHGEHAAMRDGFQEEVRGDPGGDAHLPCLQDDVVAAAPLLKGQLRGVRFERQGASAAVAHLQQALGQMNSP